MAGPARVAILWILGGAAVAALATGGFYVTRSGPFAVADVEPAAQLADPVQVAAVPPQDDPEPEVAEPAPAEEVAEAPEPEAEEQAEPQQDDPAPDLPVPSVDVVRIEQDGSGLIAGKAAPGATVSILLDDTVIESVTSDAAGSFLSFLELAPSDRPRVLTILSERDGISAAAEDQIILAPVAEPVAEAEAEPAEETVAVAEAKPEAPGETEPQVTAPEDAAEESVEVATAQLVEEPEPSTGDTAPVAEATEVKEPEPSLTVEVAEDSTPEVTEDPVATESSAVQEPVQTADVAPATEDNPVVSPDEVAAEAEEDTTSAADLISAGVGGAISAVLPDSTVETPESDEAPNVATQAEPEAVVAEAQEAEPTPVPPAADVTTAVPVIVTDAPSGASGTPVPAEAEDRRLALSQPAAPGLSGDTTPAANPVVSTAPAPKPEAPEAPGIAPATAASDPATPPVLNASAETPGNTPQPFVVLRAGRDGVEVLQSANPERPLAMDRIELDTISYSDAGDVQLAGRAQGQSTVRIYLDNERVTDLDADPQGRWTGQLDGVEPGVYTLRLDEVGADGQVLSRIETPFKREPPEALRVPQPGAAAERGSIRAVTVQKGDTLWAISRDRYGEGLLYVRVFEANRDNIRNPDLIYPGQVFSLPE